MPISVFCQGCQKTYRVKNEFAGKRGKCPEGHVLIVPPTVAALPEAPPVQRPALKSPQSLPNGVKELVARTSERKPDRQKIMLLSSIVAGVLIVATTMLFIFRPGSADRQRASADSKILKAEQEREAQLRAEEALLETQKEQEAQRQAEAARVETERLAQLEKERREKEEQARLEEVAREQEKVAAEKAERERKERELANRPPTVAIARTSPEKPRPGGSFIVQLKGQHPKGEAVTFQYRSSPEDDWTNAAGDAVSLAELQPGELRLEVRSRDNKGLTSEPLAQDWVVPPVKVKTEPTRRYKGHRTCSHGVTFTPDGQKFLSGSCDKTLKLWDTVDPNSLVEFKGVRGQIFAVDISADGKYAATGGTSDDGKTGVLQLWDMATYKMIRLLTRHTGTVTAVKFSPDGTFLASGSDDGTVVLWEVKTGKDVRTLKEVGSSIIAVAFSGDGARLLSAGTLNRSGVIRQWDFASGELLTQIAAPSEAYQRTRKDGAVGVDGMTAEEYEQDLEGNLQCLLDRVKSGTYRAPPVRRVHIPKGGSSTETRPIGIPTLEDKVLQRAVVMLLEPIYEQDFLNCSYGFRPGRSAHQALDTFRTHLMTSKGGWVLEVDIQKLAGSMAHTWSGMTWFARYGNRRARWPFISASSNRYCVPISDAEGQCVWKYEFATRPQAGTRPPHLDS